MEDREQVTIDIKTTADTKSIDQTKVSIDSVKGSLQGASQAAELFNKVLRGLGIIAIFQQIVSAAQSLNEWLNRSANEAESLGRKQKEAADSDAVKRQIETYKNLLEQLSAINSQLSRKAELEALSKGGERAMEDARSAADEAAAVASIPDSDPDRDAKAGVVRARFKRERDMAAASRRREDATLTRQNLEMEAAQKESSAAALSAQVPGMKAQLAGMRNTSEELEYRSKAAESVDLLSGARKDTTESRELAAMSAKYAQNADKLDTSIQALDKDIRTLLSDASHARSKADAAFSQYEAAGLDLTTADKGGIAAIGTADRSVMESASKRAKMAADIEAREAAAAAAQSQADDIAGNIRGLQSKASAEHGQVNDARADVDSVRNRFAGSRNTKKRDAALAPLLKRQETEEAEERAAVAELAEAMRSSGPLLKELVELAKEKKAESKQLASRLKAARGDTATSD